MFVRSSLWSAIRRGKHVIKWKYLHKKTVFNYWTKRDCCKLASVVCAPKGCRPEETLLSGSTQDIVEFYDPQGVCNTHILQTTHNYCCLLIQTNRKFSFATGVDMSGQYCGTSTILLWKEYIKKKIIDNRHMSK